MAICRKSRTDYYETCEDSLTLPIERQRHQPTGKLMPTNPNRIMIIKHKIGKGSDHLMNNKDVAKFVFNVTGRFSVEYWLKLLMNKEYVSAAIDAVDKQINVKL